MSIRQWGIITICVVLLTVIGSFYEVGAAPPEPEKGPPDQVEPTPGPAIDIKTILQRFQELGNEVTPPNDRQLQAASLLTTEQEAPIGTLGQQTFNASIDATVLQGYPTLNFGNTIDMWAGYDDSLNPDGMIARSLIKFNIAGLPPNQTITKATLRVRLVASYDFPNTHRTITTYRVISNWSEGSVTWNNTPGFGSAYGSKSIRSDDFTWHEFDVTNLVAAWYTGTFANYGIMLRGPEFSGPDSSWRSFSTREGSFKPQLVIEYGTVTNPPNPPNPLTVIPFSKSQINLFWGDNSNNEAGFKIERSPTGTTGWSQIAAVGANITSYLNTGLACGTTYYYRVRAYTAGGTHSAYSITANGTTFACDNTGNTTLYLPIIMKPKPPYDGNWVGPTSQGETIFFGVNNNAVTYLEFVVKTTGNCRFEYFNNGLFKNVTGNTFSLTEQEQDYAYTINGTFNSSSSASGHLQVTLQSCGSANITWNATK